MWYIYHYFHIKLWHVIEFFFRGDYKQYANTAIGVDLVLGFLFNFFFRCNYLRMGLDIWQIFS